MQPAPLTADGNLRSNTVLSSTGSVAYCLSPRTGGVRHPKVVHLLPGFRVHAFECLVLRPAPQWRCFRFGEDRACKPSCEARLKVKTSRRSSAATFIFFQSAFAVFLPCFNRTLGLCQNQSWQESEARPLTRTYGELFCCRNLVQTPHQLDPVAQGVDLRLLGQFTLDVRYVGVAELIYASQHFAEARIGEVGEPISDGAQYAFRSRLILRGVIQTKPKHTQWGNWASVNKKPPQERRLVFQEALMLLLAAQIGREDGNWSLGTVVYLVQLVLLLIQKRACTVLGGTSKDPPRL